MRSPGAGLLAAAISMGAFDAGISHTRQVHRGNRLFPPQSPDRERATIEAAEQKRARKRAKRCRTSTPEGVPTPTKVNE